MTTVYQFDRSKPFYPLVMHYLVLLIGVKEIAARGAVNEWRKLTGSGSRFDIDSIKDDLSRGVSDSDKARFAPQISALSQSLSKVLGPLELKSEYQGNHIKVEVDEIADDLSINASYLLDYTMRSAGSLLVLAHEMSIGKPWHDTGPLWEFLRHCRHAAAHNGLFNIDARRGAPRHPAVWGRFRIEASLNGTPLFKNDAGQGMLSPGDPIRLLWDIEQAYPAMRA